MLVAPAERRLQRVMQVGDGAVAAHQQPTPDHQADPENPYVEPVNLGKSFVCHRRISLANDWLRPQPPVCSSLLGGGPSRSRTQKWSARTDGGNL